MTLFFQETKVCVLRRVRWVPTPEGLKSNTTRPGAQFAAGVGAPVKLPSSVGRDIANNSRDLAKISALDFRCNIRKENTALS